MHLKCMDGPCASSTFQLHRSLVRNEHGERIMTSSNRDETSQDLFSTLGNQKTLLMSLISIDQPRTSSFWWLLAIDVRQASNSSASSWAHPHCSWAILLASYPWQLLRLCRARPETPANVAGSISILFFCTKLIAAALVRKGFFRSLARCAVCIVVVVCCRFGTLLWLGIGCDEFGSFRTGYSSCGWSRAISFLQFSKRLSAVELQYQWHE